MTATPMPPPARTAPGPKNTFPFGQAAAFTRNQLGASLEMMRTYGSVARIPLGMLGDLYAISSAQGAQHVLQDNNRAYHKSKTLTPLFDFLTLGPSLFTDNGEVWLKQRRLVQPAFHRHKLEHFVSGMTESANKMLAGWDQLPRGTQINAEDAMMDVTLSIVGKALFGVDLADNSSAIGKAYLQMTRYFTYRQETAFPPPIWVPTPMNRDTSRAKAFVKAEIARMLEERRASKEARHDLLQMLLESRYEDGSPMEDARLRSEISLFLLAGHETTATALTWAFHELSRHPEIESRLLEELRRVLNGRAPTLEDLPKLEYTRAVLEETMRLYPPAWGVARLAVEDDVVDGYAIPRGANVMVFSYGIQRDAKYWPEPERFNPNRFLTPDPSRPRFAYLPFGGGPRGCIGNIFAMMEGQVILASVLQRFALRVKPGYTPQPWALFTLKPRHGMPVILEPRA